MYWCGWIGWGLICGGEVLERIVGCCDWFVGIWEGDCLYLWKFWCVVCWKMCWVVVIFVWNEMVWVVDYCMVKWIWCGCCGCVVGVFGGECCDVVEVYGCYVDGGVIRFG